MFENTKRVMRSQNRQTMVKTNDRMTNNNLQTQKTKECATRNHKNQRWTLNPCSSEVNYHCFFLLMFV